MKTLAKKGFTINTIYDALGVSVALDLNQGMTTAQEFINDYSEYIPDYALSPLVITPKAFVTDPSGKTPHLPTDNVILADKVTNIKWQLVKDTGNELITSTVGGDYTISTTGATKGQLTVRKNLNVNSGRTLLFTCDFKDERTGLFQTISKTISLTCTAATLTMLKSRLFTPRGNTFNHKTASLSVHQKVYNGGEEMPDVARWWYKDGVQITPANANGITGYYSDTLVVPDSVVGDSETEIKVVADRVEDANFLYGVKDGISYTVSGGQPINTLIPNILTVDRIKSATNFNMSFKLNASNVVAQNQYDAQFYLGPELIKNGGFESDTAWTRGSGWTISGGSANCDGTQQSVTNLQQPATNLSGKWVKLSFTISNYVSGAVSISSGGIVGYGFTSGNGTYSKIVYIPTGSAQVSYVTANVAFVGSVDNVSIKELIHHRQNLITGGDFEAGLIGVKFAGNETSTWNLNNINPISGTQDGRIVVSNIGSNVLRPQLTLFSSFSKWVINKKYRISFNYKLNSGTCVLRAVYDGLGTIIKDYTFIGTGKCVIDIIAKSSSDVGALYFNGTALFDMQIDNIEVREAVEPRLFFNIPIKDKSGNAIDLQVERKFAYESNIASIVNENVNALITLPQSGAPYALNGNGVGGVQGIASGSLNVSELQLTQTNAQVPYKPAVLDGYLPATQSDRALTDKVLLKYKLEGIDYTIECPSAVKPDVKMLNPKVVLTNNQGVITNPEKRFSFLWKENGTEIGRGSNIMLPISSAQHNISVEPVLGMDYVKYMCVPDGVDDGLRVQGVDSSFETPLNSSRTWEIDFIFMGRVSGPNYLMELGTANEVLNIKIPASSGINIVHGNPVETINYEIRINLVIGRRYVLKVKVSNNVSSYSVEAYINETKITLTQLYPGAPWGSGARDSLYDRAYPSPSRVISYKMYSSDGITLLHSWDFQGATPADRLKDKVGTKNLTAVDISDLNQFFQPL